MSDLTEAPSGEKRVMEEEGGSANKKLCLEKEGEDQNNSNPSFEVSSSSVPSSNGSSTSTKAAAPLQGESEEKEQS